jgi:hypothetical protein
MDRFVHRENIRHYQRLLDAETDPDQRAAILLLLEEEHGKDEALGFVCPESSRRPPPER